MSENAIESPPHDWRGFSATGISWVYDRSEHRHDFDGEGWLAIATDPDDGQIAVSVWHNEGPGARRDLSVWMPRVAAERLIEALREELAR